MKKAALAGSIAIAALAASLALADKTVSFTLRSADSRVTAMHFEPMEDGGVSARVCGDTKLSDGTTAPRTCYRTEISGALRTSIKGHMEGSGAARQFWMNQEGL